MRFPIIVATTVAVALLSACASQGTAPKVAASAAASEKKAPQCWNGDLGKFQDVGSKTTISGVAVECKLTSDGKAASWVGGKH